MGTRLDQMGITKQVIIINAVLIFGAFMSTLNQTLLTPALPSIMNELRVDAATVQWLTTAYLLVNGIMVPVTAFLLDKFTTRFLFFFSMGLFTAGTFLAGISTTFSMILAARVLQAVGAGIVNPVGQTIMLLTVPKEYRGAGMGIIGLVFGLGPCVGPVVSGFVVDAFSWHMLFYALTPLCVLTMIVGYFYLENFGTPKEVHLDMPSVVTSTLGFGGLLYSFSVIGSSGFNVTVLAAFIVGVLSLIYFFRRQLRIEEPLLRVDILKNRTFALSVSMVMLMNAAFIVGTILNPIYVQTMRGYSATVSALMMLPAAILSALLNPVSGFLFDKFGSRRLAIPGICFAIIGTLPLTMLNEETSLVMLAGFYCFRIGSMALIDMPLNTWGLNALENEFMAHGTAIGMTFRTIASSLGTAVLITVMSVTIAASPNPTSIPAQIHGINVAYIASVGLMLTALILTILFVKDNRNEKDVNAGHE